MAETMSDHTRQLDEASVMESIFSLKEFKRSDEHGPSVGQFFANIEVPEGFRVVIYQEPKTKAVIQVSSLPEIVLHYALPERYPSESPPTFTLACDWLNRAQLSRLCHRLDSLWLENTIHEKGKEILYTWANFLRNESLDFLGILDVLDVSAIEKKCYPWYLPASEPSKVTTETKLDCRAVNNHSPHILDRLSAHDEAQKLCRHHDCNICFKSKPGVDFTCFQPCRHITCTDCTRTYFQTAVESGSVKNIRCPERWCESEAQFNQIKEHLSAELFIRYDKLLLDATLATMSDIVTCPRPTCHYRVTVEGGDNKLARCFYCEYAFCVECRMGYHGVEPCRFKADEERQLADEYRSAGQKRKEELEKRYSKRRLEELVHGSATRGWIEDNSKRCPQCRVSIQKAHGCNKIVCSKCGCMFCWLCETRLDPALPYLHYMKMASPCFKLLFLGIEDNEDGDFLDPVWEEADWAD